jgi:uncharacterized protein (DUF305 family)
MDFAWRIPAVATPRFPLHRVTPAAAVLLLMAGAVLPALAGTPAGSAPPLGAVPPVAANGPGGGPGGPGWMAPSDQRFIVMMIPHHDGAIAIADLALTRARHPELKALARRIASSQRRENAQMRAWYLQWFGSDVPVWSPGTGPGFDMGRGGWMGATGMGMGYGMGMGMAGTDISLGALRAAPDFDRAFIEQMIPHHRMGVMMASHALTGTDHPQLRALQQGMVRVQSQEIRQMADWYRRWFPS